MKHLLGMETFQVFCSNFDFETLCLPIIFSVNSDNICVRNRSKKELLFFFETIAQDVFDHGTIEELSKIGITFGQIFLIYFRQQSLSGPKVIRIPRKPKGRSRSLPVRRMILKAGGMIFKPGQRIKTTLPFTIYWNILLLWCRYKVARVGGK